MKKGEAGIELLPEPNWEAFESPFHDLEPSFVSDVRDGQGLRTHYYRHIETQRLVGKPWFGPLAKGPPGHAHGGSIAALLDDAMGTAAWLGNHSAVAAEITISFRAMLPLHEVVFLEAWIDEVKGRKVYTKGRVFSKGGDHFSEGRGVFVSLSEDQISKIATKLESKRHES